ncbi:MAG TPA: protein-L-isoaspartate O-methyltransferase [Xanthobacteraceae bacterium]|nr:protein-L-isoaspartate O-methyltransferase [Xanthobacteraceae bacterium]
MIDFDFALARRSMVDSQVRTSDVTDMRLITAMLKVPRERFVPPEQAALAYLDRDVLAASASGGRPARRLLKPMVFARLLQAAEIAANDHVLDVGCATGYSSAIIAHLTNSVVALEEDPALADAARTNVSSLGLTQIEVVTGPLVEGHPKGAPYDVIVLEGAFEVAPKSLVHQLKPGGRLVGVSGRGPNGKAMLFYRVDGDSGGRPIFDAAAPLLPGFSAPTEFVF